MRARITTFRCDITPPVGHPLCALDFAELSNHDYLRWREELATAVKTSADRVAVHCVHPHDTPWPDREAQDILDAHGHPNVILAGRWSESIRARVAETAAEAVPNMQPCSEVAVGDTRVDRIASNRRVLGDDGRVRAVRTTATRDPEVRAAPIGLIDPILRSIAFLHNGQKLAVLHYYTVHPTSYDRTGEVTPDFAGLARDERIREDNGVPHLYFTGCAGNITAGKFNDGNHRNRAIFKRRILSAMRSAEKNARRLTLDRWRWVVDPIHLPPREDLNEKDLLARLAGPGSDKRKSKAALMLTYLRRWEKLAIPVSCLHLNDDVAISW